MSITNSLYIGISGLIAHGEAISVVGDNIANTSTIGFKRARASFSDVLGGELGAQRLGGGVRLGGTQTMFEEGSINTTGNPLDVAVSGSGMFIVKGRSNGHDGQFYTRDGRFKLDNQGFVVDNRGLRLQGFTIGATGTRATTAGDLPLGARQSPAVATTKASMNLNLDANTVPNATGFDPANPNTTSDYATSTTVFDSLGAKHTVEVYFRAQGAGSWEWHAMVDGGEVGGTPGTLQEIGTGTLGFDTNGRLDTQANGATNVSFTNATPGQLVTFDFGDDIASGGTGLKGSTQSAGASSVNSVNVDGRGFGNLEQLKIDDDGTIEGVFDNGDRHDLAQIALATFASNEGLERGGDGLFNETAASGQALVDAPGNGGRGSLIAGALEGSNVDLGTELVTLIAFQRAFQANAKTVTTADEMLQEISNLKR